MRLLIDQNLSHRLVALLTVEFPDSKHVRDFGMSDASDPEIWQLATEGGFTIVSKDTDFQQRAVLRGAPPKVIWIRLGNCSTSDVVDHLRFHGADIQAFGVDPTASFLVL